MKQFDSQRLKQEITLELGWLRFEAHLDSEDGAGSIKISKCVPVGLMGENRKTTVLEDYVPSKYDFGKDFAASMRQEFRAWLRHHPEYKELTKT